MMYIHPLGPVGIRNASQLFPRQSLCQNPIAIVLRNDHVQTPGRSIKQRPLFNPFHT